MGKKEHITCVGWCFLIGSSMQLVWLFSHRDHHTTCVGALSEEAAYNLCCCFRIISSIQLLLVFSHDKQYTTCVFSNEAANNLCFLLRNSKQLVLLIYHKKQQTTCVGVLAREETCNLCFLTRSRIQLVLVGEQHRTCAGWYYLKETWAWLKSKSIQLVLVWIAS